MPRTREQNEEIRKQRIQDILDAALKVYTAKGYAAAEIGEIAEAAGMARGLIYYYYKDKSALFQELFRSVIRHGMANLDAHFRQSGPVVPLIGSFIRGMLEARLLEQDVPLFYMRMGHDIRTLFSEEEAESLNFPRHFIEVAAHALERGMTDGEIRGMSPKLLAAQVWGAAMHAIVYAHRNKRKLEQEGAAPEAIGRIIRRDLEDAYRTVLIMMQGTDKQGG